MTVARRVAYLMRRRRTSSQFDAARDAAWAEIKAA
jgi:hypothetical protein